MITLIIIGIAIIAIYGYALYYFKTGYERLL